MYKAELGIDESTIVAYFPLWKYVCCESLAKEEQRVVTMNRFGTKLLIVICALAMALSSARLAQRGRPFLQQKVVIPYNYGYEIRDPETRNFQNKAELMDEEGNVRGSYSVLLPDGHIYMTSYTVIGDEGYVARITKIPAEIRRAK